MNLRGIDLNLLVALDALLTERHVSRAAVRIGLSQPAMSNALSRIRALFADDILVRTPHGMEPTPRALELADTVKAALRQIERTFEREAAFDPATAALVFRVRMSDVLGFLLLPRVIPALERTAPGVALDISHLSPAETHDALESDRIDLAVSMGLQHGMTIQERPILDDRMVCLVRAGHPLQSASGIEAFLSHRHLRISISPTDSRFVDNILASLGRRRDVAVNIPHWLLVPPLVRTSDLVAVMPERLAHVMMHETPGLATVDLPFASDGFQWALYWHRRHDQRPAHKWLRDMIVSAAEEGVPTEPHASRRAHGSQVRRKGAPAASRSR